MSSAIFASTMLYAASKKLGLATASNELMRQVGGLAQQGAQTIIATDELEWRGIPAALTLARLATMAELELNVNAGATVIGKGRSMTAAAFLESKRAAVWVSCDDDVAVSHDALTAMVAQALREPCVVIAPCLLRESQKTNVVEPSGVLQEPEPGCIVERIAAGGFGCFAISRAIVEQAHHARGPDFDWTDEEGVTRRALFRDEVIDGKWYTEDLAFFGYTRAPVYAVRRGTTTHAGQRLDLRTLEAQRTPLVV